MADHISRRSLTHGALWAVPAIGVASAAPAFALSACPASTCLQASGGTTTWSMDTILFSSGSDVTLNFGNYSIKPGCAPVAAAYYNMQFTSITGIDQSGGTWSSSLTSSQPGTASIGSTRAIRAQFDSSFTSNGPDLLDLDWDSRHHLKAYRVCYTLTYLDSAQKAITAACAMCSMTTASSFASSYNNGNLAPGGLTTPA